MERKLGRELSPGEVVLMEILNEREIEESEALRLAIHLMLKTTSDKAGQTPLTIFQRQLEEAITTALDM